MLVIQVCKRNRVAQIGKRHQEKQFPVYILITAKLCSRCVIACLTFQKSLRCILIFVLVHNRFKSKFVLCTVVLLCKTIYDRRIRTTVLSVWSKW
jgi:hypothetical protein